MLPSAHRIMDAASDALERAVPSDPCDDHDVECRHEHAEHKADMNIGIREDEIETELDDLEGF